MPACQGIPRILQGGLDGISHEVREVEVLNTCRVRVILLQLIIFLPVIVTQEVLTCIRRFVLVENTVLEEVIEGLTAFGKGAEFRHVLILNASKVDGGPPRHSNSASRSLGCSYFLNLRVIQVIHADIH